MSNVHGLPNVQAEMQAHFGDLLSPAILATTLTAPGSGMTLPGFSTSGYVRAGTPTRLVYVNQPAAAVTITGSPGAYWLALMHDVHSAVAGWTRTPGTHYAWQAAATQPAAPPGGLVMASVTVTGTTISAVDSTPNYPATKVAYGGATGGLAFSSDLTWSAATLKAVGAVEARRMLVNTYAGDNAVAFHTDLTAGVNRWAIYAGGTAPSYLGGTLTVTGAAWLSSTCAVSGPTGLGAAPVAGYALYTGAGASLAPNVTIGLGTTPATATLDVNGSARVRGLLAADGALQTTGPLGVGMAVPAPFAAAFNDRIHVLELVSIKTQFQTYNLFCNGSAGTPGGAWINSTSRAALKQRIRPLAQPEAVLRSLQPRQWEWADHAPTLEAAMPGTQTGFVVEEVEAAMPGWVHTAPDGSKGLAMRGLDAVVVATLQDVLRRLDTLEERG